MDGAIRSRPRVTHGTKSVSAIDRHVGARIREARRARGWSRADMEPLVKLGQPQIHKIESAENKCSIQNLLVFSRALGVPIDWFFEGFVLDARAPFEALPPLEVTENEMKMAQSINRLPPNSRKLVARMIRELDREDDDASTTAETQAQPLESGVGKGQAG